MKVTTTQAGMVDWVNENPSTEEDPRVDELGVLTGRARFSMSTGHVHYVHFRDEVVSFSVSVAMAKELFAELGHLIRAEEEKQS